MRITSILCYLHPVRVPRALLDRARKELGTGDDVRAGGIGVIPLAQLMGEATEHLSERPGPTWGGLLNATFGNAAELIIGIIALTKGLNEIVKASLTGSILGNLLLVAGAAMVAGGWNREKQTFSRAAPKPTRACW